MLVAPSSPEQSEKTVSGGAGDNASNVVALKVVDTKEPLLNTKDEGEFEDVHFPWLTGPRGDFIGRKGDKEGIREILANEPSEEFVKKFYSDIVAWLEESGLPLKPQSDRVIDQDAVDRGCATVFIKWERI